MDRNELHIWHASLRLAEAELDAFNSVLSEDEKERAARFRFPVHRNRFIAARGILRSILASYLEIAPERLAFQTGHRGKPAICDTRHDSDIRFNLSHSADELAIAIVRNVEIGIDIERRDKPHNGLNISRSYFTDAETESLEKIASESGRQHHFLRLWTRKEACIKCTGDGLGAKLRSFDVSRVGMQPTPVRIGDALLHVSDLFDGEGGSAGAIAYPAGNYRHIRKSWPENRSDIS